MNIKLSLLLTMTLFITALTAFGQSYKTVMISDDGIGTEAYRITASPNGKQIVVTANGAYNVFDENGKLTFKVGVPQGSSTLKLIPAPADFDPLIKFVAIDSYAGGHVALCRADGSEIKAIIGKGGGNERSFHSDTTGWTNPNGGAVDFKNRIIFATESTQPMQDELSPVWSRIAMFDFSGEFIRSINFYNFHAPNDSEQRAESRRHWYSDIAVDPDRQRIYASARNIAENTNEFLVFNYDGEELYRFRIPGEGHLAYLPAQDIIGLHTGRRIIFYSAETFEMSFEVQLPNEVRGDIRSITSDQIGNLYVSLWDASVNFIRYNTDGTYDIFGPNYIQVAVHLQTSLFIGGQTYEIPLAVQSKPEVTDHSDWHLFIRETSGINLRWREIPVTYNVDNSSILFDVPTSLRGSYTLAIKFGSDPISSANFARDTAQLWQVIFVPESAIRSIAISATTARSAFLQGENISLELLRRERIAENEVLAPIIVNCQLIKNGKIIESIDIPTRTGTAAIIIPAAISARLATGEYEIKPVSPGYESYGFKFDIVSSLTDSTMQRVFYHEFGNTAIIGAGYIIHDPAERMANIRETVAAVNRLGFNRETDRAWAGSNGYNYYTANTLGNGMDYEGMAYGEWLYYQTDVSKEEFYMDLATKYNIWYDTQILPHCATARISDVRIQELLAPLSRSAEWMSKYPSFYGFNYNDEMFNGGTGSWQGYDNAWTQEDRDWLKNLIDTTFAGDDKKAIIEATRRMYLILNDTVANITPQAKLTTTPMWQFPATEGSYIPAFFDGIMTETYSHFLGEGYQVPFLPAHSAEMMKRPGLPLIAIGDVGYSMKGADLYQKNTFQLLTRGPQGVGVNHITAFQDPFGANSFTTTNNIAKELGTIFSTAERDDAGYVLYSYTQDVTEGRRGSGTPHWEAVYGIFGAGLMSGVPLGIIYEEDIADGRLVDGNRPTVPMLFLVNQKVSLPQHIISGIERFKQVGGKVYYDAVSTPYPGGTLIDTDMSFNTNQGYASDTAMPLIAREFEPRAELLHKAVFENVNYKLKTDNLWTISTSFIGGSARYIVFSYESTTMPWEPGVVWGMGAMYAKYQNTWFPTFDTATIPYLSEGAVVYDLLSQKEIEVRESKEEGMQEFDIDMTTLPGRLIAILPGEIGTPKLSVNQAGAVLNITVNAANAAGNNMYALIPFRLRLISGEEVSEEIFRSSSDNGTLNETFIIPASGNWSVEVTELVTGKRSIAELSSVPLTASTPFIKTRESVDVERKDQIFRMLDMASSKNIPITIVTGTNVTVDEAALNSLFTILRSKNIQYNLGSVTDPGKEFLTSPRIYVSLGLSTNDQTYGILTREAWVKNLLGNPRTPRYPGEGRGYISACFAPRVYNENVIVVIGGDNDGLSDAIDSLGTIISKEFQSYTQAEDLGLRNLAAPRTINGTATEADTTTHMDKIGTILNGIQLSSNNKDILITASGFNKNIATISDNGNSASITASLRLGQSPNTLSRFISADGKLFGAATRTADLSVGQPFYLIENTENGRVDTFTNYGDMPRQYYGAAASSDGKTVITGGTYGAVCFKNNNGTWEEAWCFDYQKLFDELDWPISDLAERIPQFHAYIPSGKDYAILCFGEMTEQGWVTGENVAGITIYSLSLSDGSVNWEYAVPISSTLTFPTMFTSPNASKFVLQVQVGTWGKETFSFFSIDPETGNELGRWDAARPMGISSSDANGNIAMTYDNRLLEVRTVNSNLIYNFLWQYAVPLSVAFSPDGNSLYVADDRGYVTRLDSQGNELWAKDIGAISTLAVNSNGLYAAGWDGHLRAFTENGELRWDINMTDELSLNSTRNPAKYLAELTIPKDSIHRAVRQSNTLTTVPEIEGVDLLKAGIATIKVGGTSGWMSGGHVEISADELIDGNYNTISKPWVTENELFWNGQSGRQVWAEMSFTEPRRVNSITVYEDDNHADAYTSEAVIQVWSDETAKWETVIYGRFMNCPINTFPINLNNVTKIRYAPWGKSYYSNIYVTEIEIR